MYYYKRYWEESTGEELTDSWGTSTYYLETTERNFVTRQLQLFEQGNCLKYDEQHFDDKFGGLSDQSIDPEEYLPYIISKEEFEVMWNNQQSINYS